ncbi:MAG: hypothetical protein HZY79_08165 [Rhodoblastus sp.]|nr:MAG: hypothetical protein HZY79_08165 [Rhodoblastus sp.]
MQNTALDSFIKIIEQCVALTAKPLLLTLLDVEEAFEVKPCNVRIIVPDKNLAQKLTVLLCFQWRLTAIQIYFWRAIRNCRSGKRGVKRRI